MDKARYFDLSHELESAEAEINGAIQKKNVLQNEINQNQQAVQDLLTDLAPLAETCGVDLQEISGTATTIFDDVELNIEYDRLLCEVDKEIHSSVPMLPKLPRQDLIVAACIGLLAALIDFFLVGIPHKGHSSKTGSPLTDILRKIGQSKDGKDLSPVLKWFERKCKVPYDVAAVKDVMYPGNHRMRSFAHDPFFGLFFAVFDCKFGTCTCIDNNGAIRIIAGREKPTIFPVILYFGHLISDLCTSSGLPVPGWVFTQFFASGDKSDISIARAAESMYREGYDLRHFASMSSSAQISKGLVKLYHTLQYHEGNEVSQPYYMKEIDRINNIMVCEKILLISDAVATSGNLVKFLVPPSNGNPSALNLPQWFALLKDGIRNTKIACRDKTPELLIANRRNIDEAWAALLADGQVKER